MANKQLSEETKAAIQEADEIREKLSIKKEVEKIVNKKMIS